MNPGRELDALVAEKVMGKFVISDPKQYLEVMVSEGGDYFGGKWVSTVLCHNETFDKHLPGHAVAIVKQYSTNISAAWEVVEKLPGFSLRKLDGAYWCTFANSWDDELIDVIEKTAPHAICLAALRAIGQL